jgi:hypothetical protein
LLGQAVFFLKQELEFTDREAVAASQDDTPVEYPRAAFIVHGRDEGTRESVVRVLQKIGIKPVILHELPDKGRTLITKFKEEAAGIGFAASPATAHAPQTTTGTTVSGFEAVVAINKPGPAGATIANGLPSRVTTSIIGAAANDGPSIETLAG